MTKTRMQFRLRTLLIVLAVGPMAACLCSCNGPAPVDTLTRAPNQAGTSTRQLELHKELREVEELTKGWKCDGEPVIGYDTAPKYAPK